MKKLPGLNRHSIFLPLGLAFFCLWGLAACEKRPPLKGLAINASFSDRLLTDDLVTKLKVKYITTGSFQPLEQEFRIVAEAFWQGKILFRESLDPEVPVSRWQANRVYEMEKYLYIPRVIDRFNPKTAFGIRIRFSILMENSSESGPLVLYSRNIKLWPCPPEAPETIFLEGWEKIARPRNELADQNYEIWTGSRAVCLLENPGRPALLMVRGSNFQESLTVSLFLDDGLLDEFTLSPGPFQKIYSLGPFSSETDQELKLTLVMDKTLPINKVYPQLNENREVGLRIEKVYFR
ncbi:MAG: hypothetical protein NUW07_09120 [Candidatus Saccharicenans sp.]|nr:hypothetical protein [Candidatus Saccharicenans sp.]MDH7493187.1 hypothetical protein [Candidatus Saccharicenans sp.]